MLAASSSGCPGTATENSSTGSALALWPAARSLSIMPCAATAAVVVPARQALRGWVGKLLERFRHSPPDQGLLLPNGASAEPSGPRRTDLILVWSEVENERLDEARIQSRWPECKDVRRLAEGLFLVSGVDPLGQGAAKTSVPQATKGCPREAARRMLTAARQAGDRRAEATALADLGVMRLQEGKKRVALTMLEKAATLTHELGDLAKESDVLGNFGKAALAAGQRKRARELFRRSLAIARQGRDPFAEKLALEHLGTFVSKIRNSARALVLFGKAIDLARETGDRHHEAKLLWQLAVAHADLGQRDQAIAQAQAAIAVFEGVGRPEAAWFADHLEKYQAGIAAPGTNGSGAAGTEPPLAALHSGSIDASATPTLTHASPIRNRPMKETGPGLLRMAGSATKAMAKFIKSGLKSVSPRVYEERLQTCSGCEYHSGLRCRICGCFTNMKAQMPHEKCPIGKWPVYVETRGPGQTTDVDREEQTAKSGRRRRRGNTKTM